MPAHVAHRTAKGKLDARPLSIAFVLAISSKPIKYSPGPSQDHRGIDETAVANPTRFLPKSKTEKYLERKTSPRIQRGPAGGGTSMPAKRRRDAEARHRDESHNGG